MASPAGAAPARLDGNGQGNIFRDASQHGIGAEKTSSIKLEVSKFEGDVNLVIVQHSREVSNVIAAKTGITHHSPQAIVLKDGKPVYHASHYDVTAQDIKRVESGE